MNPEPDHRPASRGAPTTGRARLRPLPPYPSGAPRPQVVRAQEYSETLISTSVRDVLDYFEKCPRCGYHAQATLTVHTFTSGRVHSIFQPVCASPCGWRGPRS